MTRTRFFQNMRFSPKVPYDLVLTFSRNKAHINAKKKDFGPIWTNFPQFRKFEIVFQKSGPVTFFASLSPNLLQNTRKNFILNGFQDKKLRTNRLFFQDIAHHAHREHAQTQKKLVSPHPYHGAYFWSFLYIIGTTWQSFSFILFFSYK